MRIKNVAIDFLVAFAMLCGFIGIGCFFQIIAQDKPSATAPATDTVKKATPPPKHIAITKAELGDAYANAYKNLEARRKAVEESLAWQQYIISQNQLQSTTLFIMAEMGIKPSEECKPIERDGKLLYFECPVKTEEKSKP